MTKQRLDRLLRITFAAWIVLSIIFLLAVFCSTVTRKPASTTLATAKPASVLREFFPGVAPLPNPRASDTVVIPLRKSPPYRFYKIVRA